MMRRLASLVVPIVAVATAAAGLPATTAAYASGASSAASRASSTPSVWRPWAYAALVPSDRPTSSAAAIAEARTTNVIVAQPKTFAGYASAMRTANPSLRLLAYVNGSYAQSGQASQFPAVYYSYSSTGSKIRSVGFGNYLMDPAQPGWISTVISECRSEMAASGYVGCYLDSMGPSAIIPGYTTAMPIDPATHAVWTKANWIAATTAEAKAVTAALGHAPVMVNGIVNGPAYFSTAGPTSTLAHAADGALAEIWLRSATTPLSTFPTTTAWLADVKMLIGMQTSGEPVLVTVKTWASGSPLAVTQWHGFSLGTFLLAANGNAYYSFLPTPKSDPNARDTLASALPIGSAVGGYHLMTVGLVRRLFTNGMVIVNPQATPRTTPLGGTYRTLSGQSVTSATVGPHSTLVLLG
jgi:Hypothetical glycosyl hydrolase family 15